MRFNMTDAEYALWYHLRNREFFNIRFNRQVVIGNYIVDFCCRRLKLIIELDGEQHAEQGLYDEKRTNYLASEGYRVIRFWNDEVLRNIDGVLEAIYEEIHNIGI
jgi:uncharacterized protein HI_1162